MTPFTDSFTCKSRAACRACRSLAGGRAVRAMWARAWSLPNDAIDFDCPHGVPWGFAGAEPTPAEIEARLQREGYDPASVKRSGCCDPPRE